MRMAKRSPGAWTAGDAGLEPPDDVTVVYVRESRERRDMRVNRLLATDPTDA